MKKKRKKKIMNIILISTIALLLIFLLFYIKFTGFVVTEQIKEVKFYFYDESTNCSLNGFLFIGKTLVGKTQNGVYNLSFEDYNKYFKDNDKNITLFGKLDDCFIEEGLYFDKSWKNLDIDESYFNIYYEFRFIAQILPHNPINREMLGYIEPDNVKYHINELDLKGNRLEDLSLINNYLNDLADYTKDWGIERENYWQRPTETFALNTGDCEDFSVALLSLFLAYDPDLLCYNIIFTNHVSTLCNIDKKFIYYDEEDKEIKKELKNIENIEKTRLELDDLNKEYFKVYGIDNNTNAYYAFDDNELFRFVDYNDFLNWQQSLLNKRFKNNIFLSLENEYKMLPGSNVEYVEMNKSIGELYSIKDDPQKLSTFKGFLQNNFFIFLTLVSILLILIVLLIKINKK